MSINPPSKPGQNASENPCQQSADATGSRNRLRQSHAKPEIDKPLTELGVETASVLQSSLPDDLKAFELSFLTPRRYFVSVSVPEHIYRSLQRYGISKFFEEAVDGFDGDLPALLTASLEMINARRQRKPDEAISNCNGRILKETLDRIEEIQNSLIGIKGMSRAKVLAGLVQLKLNAIK